MASAQPRRPSRRGGGSGGGGGGGERRTLEVDYRPRRGILTPVDGARTTALEFTTALLGTQLVGYTGMHDYYARKSGDGPVDFRLLIDGRVRLTLRHHNQDGWRRFA